MKYYIKSLIAFFFLLLHPIFSNSFEERDELYNNLSNHIGELKGAISVKGTSYYNRSYPVGFQLELLNRFGEHQHIEMEISISKSDILEKLLSKEIDIAVINPSTDSIPDRYLHQIVTTTPIEDGFIWVTRNGEDLFQKRVSRWLNHFACSKDYRMLESKYYRFYHNSAELQNRISLLSPYDQIIKKHSAKIGWDWRLVASIIYQESKFRVGAKSHRDATGLMQLLPSTAAIFGVEDLYSPEENIRAGTQYLKRLSSYFRSDSIDSLNQIKIILAAYNAGEGRVEDIFRTARYKELPTNNWDSLKVAIGYMGEGDLPEGVVKYGKFLGRETITYVDEVMARYQNYKEHIKK
ncbi:MAG: transglycosylase SLT domain-containing protein [Bacteroidales bacterium]